MAKVSLRIYNREIESLIDQGHLDEAVAHCRHILKTFPKHLETYRLLGKAYLEAKRYAEAVDIFNRVLMSVPDDFVANVGLSIIRDEENNLDDAIWHMERAFEAQPSNAAIQAEMQRLYGRRDGVEPPKIRMTRGALAHMYVQGELYPQAISEIRAVLASDPQRADMQVLLARAFFKSGQKADASDMCTQLLKRYPYCFDANRIMVELLPASERAESTQVYRHRVNELDPYSMFVKDSVFRSAEVPDASVNLERLEYTGQEIEMGRDWEAQSGMGLTSTSVSAGEPEWLKSGFSDLGAEEPSASDSDRQPTSTPTAKSDIPDFLRQAGWTESNRGGEEPSSLETPEDEALAEADIPDWLKGQMPVEASSDAKTQPPVSMETPDWLSGLDSTPAAQPEAASNETPDWLSGLGASQPAEEEPAQASDMPDWLTNLSSTESAEPAPAASPESTETLAEASLPDWLSPASTPAPEEEESEPAKPVPPASVENLGTSASEQDAAIAWLEMLAAKHGAKPEELVTDPAKRTEKPPEWVEQARALAESESQPLAPAAEPASSLDETGIWLRDLEQKDAESHMPVPEEGTLVGAGETPDWLSGLESKPAEEAQPAAEPLAEANLPDWLSGLESKPAEETQPAEEPLAAADLPDWLAGLDKPRADARTEEQTPAQETSETDWRTRNKNLPRTRPLDEAALTQQANVPDWLIGMEDESEEAEPQKDVAEWLSSLDKETPTYGAIAEEKQEEPVAAESADLPDWLRGLESPSATVAEEEVPLPSASETEEEAQPTPAEAADVPEWLRGLETPSAAEEEVPLSRLSEETAQETPAEAADLPDWLVSLESAAEKTAEEEEELSLPRLSETEETLEQPAEEPAPAEAASPSLPEWLRGLDQPDEEDKPVGAVEDVPSWLKGDFEEEEPHPAPRTPEDWRPAEPRVEPPVREPEAEYESPLPSAQVAPTTEEPLVTPPQPQVAEPVATPVTPPERPARPTRIKQAEPAQVGVAALSEAQTELNRGDIPAALDHYYKLIRKGKHLEETIRHLRDSLYRYPVEVGIWQALGDAYMRANRLQEALDAYNKAEELLR